MTNDQGELAIYRPVGEGGSLSALDERLLQVMGSNPLTTPEQLAEQVGFGLSPARAAARVHEIMVSQDWLSKTEQKALMLMDLIRLRDVVWEQVEAGGVRVYDEDGLPKRIEADPRWSQTLVRVFREWRNLIESMQADVASEKSMVRDAHAAIMIGALEVMFQRFLLRVEKAQAEGRTLGERDYRDLMEEVIPLGFASITEKRNAA